MKLLPSKMAGQMSDYDMVRMASTMANVKSQKSMGHIKSAQNRRFRSTYRSFTVQPMPQGEKGREVDLATTEICGKNEVVVTINRAKDQPLGIVFEYVRQAGPLAVLVEGFSHDAAGAGAVQAYNAAREGPPLQVDYALLAVNDFPAGCQEFFDQIQHARSLKFVYRMPIQHHVRIVRKAAFEPLGLNLFGQSSAVAQHLQVSLIESSASLPTAAAAQAEGQKAVKFRYVVTGISKGAAQDYNEGGPRRQILEGDRIIMVNEVDDDQTAMLEALKTAPELHLTILSFPERIAIESLYD